MQRGHARNWNQTAPVPKRHLRDTYDITGFDESEVVEFLGDPEEKTDEKYTYSDGSGIRRGNETYVIFEDGRVVDVYFYYVEQGKGMEMYKSNLYNKVTAVIHFFSLVFSIAVACLKYVKAYHFIYALAWINIGSYKFHFVMLIVGLTALIIITDVIGLLIFAFLWIKHKNKRYANLCAYWAMMLLIACIAFIIWFCNYVIFLT